MRRVQKGTDDDAQKAMEEICRLYWYPIYAYARRSGFGPHDAEDLAQLFFQQMIARETIQAARSEKGRLRTFMLAMLKRLISKQIRHDVAEKRGGSRNATLSWDELTAEENLTLLVELAGAPVARASIHAALDAVALGKKRGLPARVLSQGQRRRIGLARLRLLQRRLWILDEPVTALDAAGTALLARLVAEHLDEGGITVAATHAPLGLPEERVRALSLA